MIQVTADKSHDVLSDMAKHDVEQPGDTPSEKPDERKEEDKQETEAAPRESD